MNSEISQSAQEPARALGVDQPYTFGRPLSTYLAPRQIVRLTILRSRLRDSRGAGLGPTRLNAEAA